MARSAAQEAGKPSSRKRQLNIIYFVDSARTRSLTVPLGRLKALFAMLFAVVAWGAVSTAALVWLQGDKVRLTDQLQTALSTIFEYESRYDRVFETAYPVDSRKLQSGKGLAAASRSSPSASASAATPMPTAAPVASSEPASNDRKSATAIATNASDSVTAGAPPAASGKPAAAAAKLASAETSATPNAGGGMAPAKDFDATIAVTNPVLEPKDGRLELRFDLTNKSNQARAEGFLWAIAEFRADDGTTAFVGAPAEIDVGDNGEPKSPRRSTPFGIRRFKKSSFSFPYAKDRPGTFVGIRIGVMDKTGTDRSTYNVPVEIRVPKGS